jgi:hypothetical protein
MYCLSALTQKWRQTEGCFMDVWSVINLFVQSALFKNIVILKQFKMISIYYIHMNLKDTLLLSIT